MTITNGQAKPFPYGNFRSLGTWPWSTPPRVGDQVLNATIIRVTPRKVYLSNSRSYSL